MLSLAAFEHGNVVLSEGGQRATCDVRKKATAQAIMRPQLAEGMTFIMTFWGTGVIKMRTFSSMAKAKDWFISGLHFPPGSIRLRTQTTNYVAVSVFCDRLVCTSIDQLEATFIIKKTSENCILAFDVESGDVRINIGQLTYYGTPVLNFQGDLFEDHSHYLQIEDSNNGTSIQSVHPNPSSMCQVMDVVLSPGDVLKVFVNGTRNVKDTGAYIRLWLLSVDQENNLNLASEHKSGNFLPLKGSSTEEYHLHVKANEILVLNRAENPVVDSIAVSTDLTTMTLAFELYKVSVSVTKTGNPLSNEVPDQRSTPLLTAPKPHHKKMRRNRTRATASQSNYKVEAKQGSSPCQTYLTPKLVVINPTEVNQGSGNQEMNDRDPDNNNGGRIGDADHGYLSNHEIRQAKFWSDRSPNRLLRASQTDHRATQKHPMLEILSYPVQVSNCEIESVEETDLKTVWTNDANTTWTNCQSNQKPAAKIVGHPNLAEAKAGHHGAMPKANGALSIIIEEAYVDTDNVPCAHNVSTVVRNAYRLSAFEKNDTLHQTNLKTF